MAILWGNFDLMGTNPASVNMQTGDILLNMNVFPYLDRFTQKTIIEHEKAHFDLQTDDEYLADRTALNKLYKTEYRSLKKGVKALADFLGDDDDRIERIYKEALKIDKGMTNNNLFRNRRHPFFMNADGENEGEDTNPPDVVTGMADRQSRRTGRGDSTSRRFVSVGGWLFSMGELVMIFVSLLIYFAVKKK